MSVKTFRNGMQDISDLEDVVVLEDERRGGKKYVCGMTHCFTRCTCIDRSVDDRPFPTDHVFSMFNFRKGKL
jgi:hypothetical protein